MDHNTEHMIQMSSLFGDLLQYFSIFPSMKSAYRKKVLSEEELQEAK